MRFLKLVGMLLLSFPLFFAAHGEMGISFEGRYDTAIIKKDTNMNTGAFRMTGLEWLFLFQSMPGLRSFMVPYIGFGLGVIPAYVGTKVDFMILPNVKTQITLEDVTYLTLELGPEFIYSTTRWQMFLGYDYGFGGALARSDTPKTSTGVYSDTKLKIFKRLRLGTRVYYLFSPNIDGGFVLDYMFNGFFKDTGKNNVNNDNTKYKFTEISIGLAVRARFF